MFDFFQQQKTRIFLRQKNTPPPIFFDRFFRSKNVRRNFVRPHMKLDSERRGSGRVATTSSQNLHRTQRCEANHLKLPKTCRNDGRLLEKKILDRFRTPRHASNLLREFRCSSPGGRSATRGNGYPIWVVGIDPGFFSLTAY